MMELWIIKHEPTGNAMPLFPTNRGYSHWHPMSYQEYKTPRFFLTRRAALNALSYWLKGESSWKYVNRSYGELFSDSEAVRCFVPVVGRIREEMRIIKVVVEEKPE